MLFSSGSKYIGEWYEDLKHGRGKFVFQSGQVFEGQFHKDKMVGGGSAGGIGAQEAGLIRPQTPLGSLIGEIPLSLSLSHTHTRHASVIYTGDIDHSDFMSGGSITEKFNFQISKLLPKTNAEYELKQIHCVLLRHITQLKKIYHHYRCSTINTKMIPVDRIIKGLIDRLVIKFFIVHSSLGSGPAEIGKRGCTLTQMQLWRLWRDCKIHHQGITLCDVDNIVCKLESLGNR